MHSATTLMTSHNTHLLEVGHQRSLFRKRVPSVFGHNLPCELVRGANTRELCDWAHTCKSFKRTCVGFNGILEYEFLPKKRALCPRFMLFRRLTSMPATIAIPRPSVLCAVIRVVAEFMVRCLTRMPPTIAIPRSSVCGRNLQCQPVRE
jgi:hypothetical protein